MTRLKQSWPLRLRTRRAECLGLLLVTLPLGLAWRLAPLHLPQFALKYGGSAMWAMAVYWVVAFFMPRLTPRPLAVVAAAVAISVELAKLIFWPPLDRFRETLPGKLLLGRYFTFGAIAAYWIAISLVALVDWRLHPGRALDKPDAPDHLGDNTVA